VCRISQYCGDIFRRYWCLTSFFPIVDMCLSCSDIARQSCTIMPRWRFFGDFLRTVFCVSPFVLVHSIRHCNELCCHCLWSSDLTTQEKCRLSLLLLLLTVTHGDLRQGSGKYSRSCCQMELLARQNESHCAATDGLTATRGKLWASGWLLCGCCRAEIVKLQSFTLNEQKGCEKFWPFPRGWNQT